MIISSCFDHHHNFYPLLLHYSKFYGRILDSFEFWKFCSNNPEAKAKDKKANITVTYCKLCNLFSILYKTFSSVIYVIYYKYHTSFL